jgi:two-component system sensor histidine kinase UhpB
MVQKALALTSDALDETRGVATALRPPRLHERGLASAFEDLAAGAGVAVLTRIAPEARRPGLLDTDRELETYRIVQEALANACRHAAASRITLSMDVDRNALVIGVDDDGRGFTIRRRDTGSLGIAGMHERAAMLGATLRIRSGPGAGTTVRLAVPVTSVRPTRDTQEPVDPPHAGRAATAPPIGGMA